MMILHTLVSGTSVGKTIPSCANNDCSSSVMVAYLERLVGFVVASVDVND